MSKVYCKNCKSYWEISDGCEVRVDNYYAPAIIFLKPEVKNKRNDCKDFKQRKDWTSK